MQCHAGAFAAAAEERISVTTLMVADERGLGRIMGAGAAVVDFGDHF